MFDPRSPEPKTTNTIDITNLTDAVLDAYLDAKAGGDFYGKSVAHLTITEKYWLARALEIDTSTPAFQYWLNG